MGRPKKNLEQQPDVNETGLIYEKEEDIDKNPLHTKYDKFINQAKEGYIIGFTYPMAIEILRYCERKKGCNIGLNMSCPNCLIDLLKMFDYLREK